ncbi:ATP-binding protein [Nitrospira moscoviensis]|uniref:histidine kinase n=1 Tax=Nitrospira moscoviensis TaxID=42253 RepID=A0A0K2GIT1_NITMO|nr:ATP-binding protein [Nitrospira moscoviensis]ALA60779.1 putative Histidine kinase [Nitrospira moscoviensis]
MGSAETSHALDEAYAAWRRGFLWQRVRLFIWIDLVINPFFAFVDAAKVPQAMGALLKVRGVLEGGLLLCLLALATQVGRRRPEWIFVSAACLTGLSIAHLTIPTGGFSSFHANSLAILIVGTTVLAPVRMPMHLIIQLVALTYFFTLNLATARSRGAVDLQAASQYTFLFWLCFICDLSVFKYEQLQRAEFRARQELESSNAKLRELDQLKSRFFANVSHELRTPLTLILGSFKHLMGERLSAGCRDLAQAGLRNASRLLLHINELLDLAKFESGKLTPVKQCLDLAPLVRQVASNFESSERPRIKLEGLHDAIVAEVDPRLFKKLLYNLLSNAFKFSDPDKGRVWIRLRRSGSFVELDVEDNGIGIPEDQLGRIFERFTQVEQTESRRHEGTGIGLALVKEVAEHHGGSVSVVSTPGQGTVFTVSLPIGAVGGKAAVVVDEDAQETIDVLQRDAKSGGEIARRQAPAAHAEPNAPLVLVVEDNPDLSLYLHRLLSAHYRVVTAADGCDGLERARAFRPDLILTDVMMPRMTGHELLREVRADADLRALPVIFLTARGGSEARIESLEAGADDYLTKPFDEGELLARVKNLLQIRAQERELEALNHRLTIRLEEQMLELMRNGQLKRFLSPQLVNLILSGTADDVLKSHRREIVVVFLDLRGFTAFADVADPEEVMAVLREYQMEMGRLITEYEGTLERFTGDGMMIFFNDPVPVANPEERAIRMAVAMRQKMGMLQKVWAQRGYHLGHGIGMSSGQATLGTIGFEGRWDYAAIGTVTNLSARLCSEAAPGHVLVSHQFLRKIEHLVDAEPIGELPLKGFQRPVTTFNIRRLIDGR